MHCIVFLLASCAFKTFKIGLYAVPGAMLQSQSRKLLLVIPEFFLFDFIHISRHVQKIYPLCLQITRVCFGWPIKERMLFETKKRAACMGKGSVPWPNNHDILLNYTSAGGEREPLLFKRKWGFCAENVGRPSTYISKHFCWHIFSIHSKFQQQQLTMASIKMVSNT